jgi:hypothetical protein
MYRLLILAIFVISAVPLFAHAQPDLAKLKADARNLVGVIGSDKTRSRPIAKSTL